MDLDFSRTLAAIGGAAARRRLHALHPARPGDEGAATGFALILLAHLAASAGLQHAGGRPTLQSVRPILWILHRGSQREAGLPYGPGLPALGFTPAHVIFVTARTALDALAAAEIGLETGGLEGVLAELPPRLPADMLALGKRLALRAERSATPCLLLHASATPVQAPVATRWQIASAAAVADGAWGEPRPMADLALVKNRSGPTGRWSVSLVPPDGRLGKSSGERWGLGEPCGGVHVRVPVSAPLSEPVDAVPADRPGPAPAWARVA